MMNTKTAPAVYSTYSPRRQARSVENITFMAHLNDAERLAEVLAGDQKSEPLKINRALRNQSHQNHPTELTQRKEKQSTTTAYA